MRMWDGRELIGLGWEAEGEEFLRVHGKKGNLGIEYSAASRLFLWCRINFGFGLELIIYSLLSQRMSDLLLEISS